MMALCARIEPEPLRFIADHPFVFIIMASEIVLFLGRMSVPK